MADYAELVSTVIAISVTVPCPVICLFDSLGLSNKDSAGLTDLYSSMLYCVCDLHYVSLHLRDVGDVPTMLYYPLCKNYLIM